jgi:hypothetical protein
MHMTAAKQQIKNYIRIFLIILFCTVLLLQNSAIVLALSKEQKQVMDSGALYTNVAPDCSVQSNNSQPASSAQPQINLDKIAQKYSLQSAIVKPIGDTAVASYKADQAPDATASVLKLLIADVLLHKNPDLNQKVKIKSSELYSSGDATVGQSISIRDVMRQTLSERSWDTGANVLIDAAGGLSAITNSAHNLGYSSTNIVTYYHDPPAGRNLTTVSDLTKAMEDIFAKSSADFKVAQEEYSNQLNIILSNR